MLGTKTRRTLAAVIGVLVLAALALGLRPQASAPVPAAASMPAGAAPAAHSPAPAFAAAAASASRGDISAEDVAFLERLRDKFGPQIQSKHAQIKAIEQLVAYLMARYPDDWQSRVRDLLQALFPQLADALYTKFEQLLQHNEWLRSHRNELTRMSAAERRKALWDARRAAFGAEADEIWAAELKNERIHLTLEALESAQNLTPDEKLARYVGAIEQTYGAQAAAFIQHRQTELMNNFLEVASVQTDLHTMSASERNAALRKIRGALGLDEAALKRWSQLDRGRDQAWDLGQQYLKERERILAQHKGAERERQLHELQDRSFGAEAETVRSEEAAGFFRFAHPRKLGRE